MCRRARGVTDTIFKESQSSTYHESQRFQRPQVVVKDQLGHDIPCRPEVYFCLSLQLRAWLLTDDEG